MKTTKNTSTMYKVTRDKSEQLISIPVEEYRLMLQIIFAKDSINKETNPKTFYFLQEAREERIVESLNELKKWNTVLANCK